jgi:hypothetical protein
VSKALPRGTALGSSLPLRGLSSRGARCLGSVGILSVVLLDNLARKPSAFGYVEATLFGPGADAATALPAGHCPGCGPRPPRSDELGSLQEARELSAEFVGVPRVQIDFISAPVDAEFHRFVGRPTCQVIFQSHIDPLH